MKIRITFNLLMVAALLASFGTGCKKAPVKPTPLDGPMVGDVGDPGGGDLMGSGDGSDTSGIGFGNDGIGDPTSIGEGVPGADPTDLAGMTEDRAYFSANTVYFDLDKSDVKPGEEVKLEAIAEYYTANPSHHLLIEGHCDERGTEEYNRALGERRALTLREYLTQLGVDSQHMHTLSYGEDNPAEVGADEATYALNRRGEFVLYTP